MRRNLAERLLAKIMAWTDEEKAFERPVLESFANYKYDEYQQYGPGLRFLESLARWLGQFKSLDERRTAYEFVRNRIIFISEAEMNYLVELAFPTILRPYLVERAVKDLGCPPFCIRSIAKSIPYRQHLRRMLVLGMSDGARTGQFRRANPQNITNEQIWHAYDISEAKARNLKEKLEQDINELNKEASDGEPQAKSLFETIVLLDDFTASGTSFLREDEDTDGWEGKIDRTLTMLEERKNGLGLLMGTSDIKVIVIFYVATTRGIQYLRDCLSRRGFRLGEVEFRVVLCLGEVQLALPQDDGILGLVEKYWDESVDDEHAKVGGKSFRYGYSDCALPVVLSYNTPNNSIFLLWAEESSKIHGLFPRVSRHRTFR